MERNIICLHHAGGASYAYNDLKNYIPGNVRLVPVDLPGRGKRYGKPLLTNIHEMTDDVLSQILGYLDEPYVIYGHSMGALIGYLLAKLIVMKRLPKPAHLYFSGRYAPSVESSEKDVHLLPDEQFIMRVKKYGGLPDEIARDSDLMEMFVPILRADFQAVANYGYEPGEPLKIPITAMIGSNDIVTYGEALKWREVTAEEVNVMQFPGDHFFIFDHLPEICRILAEGFKY